MSSFFLFLPFIIARTHKVRRDNGVARAYYVNFKFIKAIP